MKLCCRELDFFLKEKKVSIGYNARFRSYYIPLAGLGGVQRITFCPWCGTKLPPALDDEYDEAISSILNIPIEEITLDPYHDPNLPAEFKSDEWWKKQGL